jgi:hypothetical protein
MFHHGFHVTSQAAQRSMSQVLGVTVNPSSLFDEPFRSHPERRLPELKDD